MTKVSYDEKCEELARYFLSSFDNKPEHIAELSELIQKCVEDYISDVFTNEDHDA